MKTKLAKRLSSIFKLSPEFFEIKNQNQIEKESEDKGGWSQYGPVVYINRTNQGVKWR